jgi:hypothetical protein
MSTQATAEEFRARLEASGRALMSGTAARPDRATPVQGRRLTPGEWMLLGVVGLAFLHHVDHVLRADNSGWPFTPDVTPFTISLLVYPIFAIDFLLLRNRPWVRVGLVAVLFAALQVTHAVFEPPSHQYGTWAHGTSSIPRALGQPNLLEVASPVLGALSVAVSALLSLAVLLALVLLAREARAVPAKGHPHDRREPDRLRSHQEDCTP